MSQLYPLDTVNPMDGGGEHELEKDLMNDVTLNHEAGIKKKKVSRLLTPSCSNSGIGIIFRLRSTLCKLFQIMKICLNYFANFNKSTFSYVMDNIFTVYLCCPINS